MSSQKKFKQRKDIYDYHYLKAPKKELIWFEKSAHFPCFEEAEKFNTLMVDKVLGEIYGK